ncbi:MAG: hypothetical protein A3F12_07275 [Gammaproteobacteria bacterium RIFCSPHIGHO2_12_FULL_38_14]|nr:MAG: hypothetical protein A3F12_07275 [Gammaproteobacteria bacterium RIFCSPHIGHO2_12_FULL_38_14]
MAKKWLVLLLSIVFILSACNSPVYNQTEGNVAKSMIKVNQSIRRQDLSVRPKPSLLVKRGLYVDTTPISLDRDPSWLKAHIVIRGDQLPFSYYSRVIASGAGKNVLVKYQSGLNQSVNVTLNYSGTVRGALNLLASKTGFVFTVSRNGIYWQAFISKTYDVAFMPGGTDYLMGQASGSTSGATSASGGGGTSGSVSDYVTSDMSASQYSNLKGTLSLWKDLELTIKQLLSPDGTVMVSESTTSVTVRDRPTNVQLVGQYISNLNHNLSKQVLVKVQIIDIELLNNYNMGINWSIITKAFNQTDFLIKGNYGTPVAITSLVPQPTGQSTPIFGPQGTGKVPSYTILLNALSEQGKTSIVSEPRVVCLNNQVSVIRIVTSQGYAASVQNTTLTGTEGGASTTGTVTSQITPGTVVTGLTLYILPKILKDSIYLQVNADLSTLNALTNFGPSDAEGNQTSTLIQLPRVTQKGFNQRSVIHSGDTLILSGFRQVMNSTGAAQMIESQTLGGKASQQKNVETIILITPIILSGSA